MTTTQPLLAGLAAALFSASAMAVPSATLSYLEREGVTDGTANVDIWLRLTANETVAFNGTSGFLPGELSEFATIDVIAPTASATCSSTFWPTAQQAACYDAASPWRFEFNSDATTSWEAFTGVTLAASEHRDFLIGRFAPQNGRVAPGVYASSNFTISLVVTGADAAGAPLERWFALADSCPTAAPECAFVRTVTAVPEPATAALLPLGLAVLAWRRRALRAAR